MQFPNIQLTERNVLLGLVGLVILFSLGTCMSRATILRSERRNQKELIESQRHRDTLEGKIQFLQKLAEDQAEVIRALELDIEVIAANRDTIIKYRTLKEREYQKEIGNVSNLAPDSKLRILTEWEALYTHPANKDWKNSYP